MKIFATYSLLLAVTLFANTTNAQSGLPKTVKVDIKQQQIVQFLKNNDFLTAHKLFKEYESIKGKKPESLMLSQDGYTAINKQLEAYLSEADRGSSSYQKALSMYADVSSKLQAQMANRLKASLPEMVSLPSGSFQMGCVSGQDCDSDETPVHRVSVSAFKLSKIETTQALWELVMQENRSRFKGALKPVERVSWNDVHDFIDKLNAVSNGDYRLPSEAEWEYAARAGSVSKHPWGDKASEQYANYVLSKTVNVGQYPPNAFGLYDMHGNVWEWVEDCWNGNYDGSPAFGEAWLSGNCVIRVLRGGAWGDNAYSIRSANRNWYTRDFRRHNIGFRLAQDMP